MRGRRGSFGARARASRDGASVRERQLRGPAGRRAAAPAAAPSAAPASGRPRPRPRPARRVAASNNGCALGPASAAGARRAGPLPGLPPPPVPRGLRGVPARGAAAAAPRPGRPGCAHPGPRFPAPCPGPGPVFGLSCFLLPALRTLEAARPPLRQRASPSWR